MADIAHLTHIYKVYSDGSGFEDGVGASAVLYKKDKVIKVLCYYLGTSKEHTVYEVEGVGAAMGLHLLKGLNSCLTSAVALGTDSQALLKALDSQRSHAGQYILDEIHSAAEKLHAKQDGLINSDEQEVARRDG